MDRKLIDYLPPVLRDIAEFKEITRIQQEKIKEAWDALEAVLGNQFIDTATEDGLKMWEKELSIISTNSEPTEVRKKRIKSRWLNQEVYTIGTLREKLDLLCGKNNFTINTHFDEYLIELKVFLEKRGQVAELKNIIDEITPCNMVVISENTVICNPGIDFSITGIVLCTDLIEIKQEAV